MIITVNDCQIELIQGDITEQSVDAIVNAANSRLAGGGGVDGAIHRKGGPSIMAATRMNFPSGCSTGSAVPTSAGKLSAQFVFHAVGPIWDGGNRGEAELLAGAYDRCLSLAVKHHCHSIAFPALSSGAYGYPLKEAASIALNTTIRFLNNQNNPKKVRFVLFDLTTFGIFQDTLEQITRKPDG